MRRLITAIGLFLTAASAAAQERNVRDVTADRAFFVVHDRVKPIAEALRLYDWLAVSVGG